MRWYAVAVAACAGIASQVAGCGDTAVVVTVDSNLSVPGELDAICLSVADTNASGGVFSHRYRFGTDIDSLPQSLTVLPGRAASAVASVRGYRNGIEVARASAPLAFSSGDVNQVSLALDACTPRAAGAPKLVASAPLPAGAVVAASYGAEGTVIAAFAQNQAEVYRAHDGALDKLGASPAGPAAAPSAVVAFDADGDCDDDLLVLSPGQPAALWRRDRGPVFTAVPGAVAALGTDAVAAAAGDVDGDGDIDLVAGGGGHLVLLRNDGSGRFAADAAAIPQGAVTDVTAIALGDIDGDGHLDIVVGQGSAAATPTVVLVNDANGTGTFSVAPGVLPPVPSETRGLAAVDTNGDGAVDLVVAGHNQPVRNYVNRGDGFLEDKSYVTLPATDAVDATSVAAAPWAGDCLVDVAVGLASGPPLVWRGKQDGTFAAESITGAGTSVAGAQALLVDVDDDGARDLILAGDSLLWIKR